MNKMNRNQRAEPRLDSPGSARQHNDNQKTEEPVRARSTPDISGRENDGGLRHEQRDERMHIRVALPFDVVIDGRRLPGHEISVGGFSTDKTPPLDTGTAVEADLAIRCRGFRATMPVTARMVGTAANSTRGRFEFVDIDPNEASILRRLIKAHLAGVNLSFDQLSRTEDPQTMRDRVKKTVKAPDPRPSTVNFGLTLAVIAVLILGIGAALYERLFVIEPDFAAVTAPEIRIFAPVDGELASHDLNPGDRVERDQELVKVVDPEARSQLMLARATLNYNDRLMANLKESLEDSGDEGVSVMSGGPISGGAPVLTKLSPIEIQARIRELETTHDFATARIKALEAKATTGVIRAPCDCLVQSIRSGEGGYWLQKGSLIAQLIETGNDDVSVEALVHLDNIGSIEPNEKAQIVLPTTGETREARVAAIQLESQNIERAGFPEWARQDMSHGSVILAADEPLPPQFVGHPVEVRFIDTESLGGDVLAGVFGTINDLFRNLANTGANMLASGGASDEGRNAPAAKSGSEANPEAAAENAQTPSGGENTARSPSTVRTAKAGKAETVAD